MRNGLTESRAGTPRAAWSNRTCRYQRNGRTAPQSRANVAHRHDGKSHSGEAERRIADQCDEAQSGCERCNQQNQQSAKGKVGDDEETGRRGDEQRSAAEGDVVEDVDDGGVHHHHDDEDGEQGHKLADSATSGLPPAARSQARLLRLENSEPTA